VVTSGLRPDVARGPPNGHAASRYLYAGDAQLMICVRSLCGSWILFSRACRRPGQ